jgi:hypothetical protein
LKTFAALGLNHPLSTPAKAFPVAFWTPDATGAMTAAVIASVVHDSVNQGNYREGAETMSSE